MRMLVLGVDGGDQRVFDAFEMPNLKNLTQSAKTIPVTEDLWSRGWAEMLTDQDVLGMGGVYERPMADGSRNFTQRFGKSDIEENKRICPLWDLLSQRGVKSGFMNVPGTYPATPVSGFMVSGAGAGVGSIDGIPQGLCSSDAVQIALEKHGYIPDIRFISSGIRDEDEFFLRLEAMLRKRVETFVSLAREQEPEFAMLALMATQRVQYLAMSEIQGYVENPIGEDGIQPKLSPMQKRILKLFACLDDAIGYLFDRLKPERFILTSDHGAAPFEYTINVDVLLERIGLLTLGPPHTFWRRRLERTKPSFLPYYFLRVFANSILREIRDPVDWSQTLAFGHRYIPGIYLNDSRFGGTVADTKNEALIERIIHGVNSSPEAEQFNLYARPYRQIHTDSPYEMILPDVWIDAPDTMFFEGSGEFVENNPHYGPITDLRVVPKDMFTGIKGRHPILIADEATASLTHESDPKNLTLVYRLVERTFR